MAMMLDMGSGEGEEREKGVLLAKPLAGGGAKGEGAVEADGLLAGRMCGLTQARGEQRATR